jgi:hypothetical protein
MPRQRLDPKLAAALWIALIYTSIPFVRQMREAFAARWPAELIGVGVIVAAVGALVVSVIRLRRRTPRPNTADLLWLSAVTLTAVVWTVRLMGRPEEAVHFVEYGVLGLLLYRALATRITDVTVFLSATLIGLLVGTVDELIQWLVPGRFWDFRDIVLNGGAVALVQIAIWRLTGAPPQPVGPASIRRALRLAAALVALLTLCLAATPQRLDRLADHIHLPPRLATGTDAICEYGYRHTVDDRTAFQSRLSLDELARTDSLRGTDIAQHIRSSRAVRGPSRIVFSPVDDPFAYEFQVHLFARNRNLHRARQREPGSSAQQRFMTTAWRQNLILEQAFSNTLAQSPYGWGPRVKARVEDAQDPGAFFVSRVGAHLITRLSEGQLRGFMVVVLVALLACDIALARRSRPGVPAA